MRNLAAAYPEANQGNGATVVPLDDQLVGGVRCPSCCSSARSASCC